MRNPFIAMAAAAAIMMAAMRENRIRDFSSKHNGWDGGNRGSHKLPYAKNRAIPKWARRYSKRYGGTIHHDVS